MNRQTAYQHSQKAADIFAARSGKKVLRHEPQTDAYTMVFTESGERIEIDYDGNRYHRPPLSR